MAILRPLLTWLRWQAELTWRSFITPRPPFRACKSTATIMYGVWYGKFTPDEARRKAAAYGYDDEAIESMISSALEPPSYWSSHPIEDTP